MLMPSDYKEIADQHFYLQNYVCYDLNKLVSKFIEIAEKNGKPWLPSYVSLTSGVPLLIVENDTFVESWPWALAVRTDTQNKVWVTSQNVREDVLGHYAKYHYNLESLETDYYKGFESWCEYICNEFPSE